MSATGTGGRARRRGRLLWLAVALVAIGAAAAVTVAVRSGHQVSWAEVREAWGRQETIGGVGRAIDSRGEVWEYGLWVEVVSPMEFAPRELLRPAEGAPSGPPDSELLGVIGCLNYSGAGGYVSAWAEEGRSTRGRVVDWQGKPALEVTVPRPVEQPETGSEPDRLRYYVDQETDLIRGLEVFRGEKLRASAQYHYNKPLPPGFRPD